MNMLLKSIAFNEASYNVALLHKTLEVFGLPVSKKEVEQNKAGQDTRKKVRALQKQLNVPVDDSTLVNDATVAAVAEALNKRGLTAASRSFTVTGTARLPDMSVKPRQRLLAFDLDLGGVAIYHNVKSLAEIKKTGGFEFIGQAVCDKLGNYRITFYDWQYRRAERKKADVVVFAIDENRSNPSIIGHSRLVNSDDYSDQRLVQRLDVIITQTDARSEYQVLMSALNAFLKESAVSLREIAASSEQLTFTAGELDLDLARLRIAAAAELLEPQRGQRLSHELLYGIGRQGVGLTWTALYKKPDDELKLVIAKSAAAKIIRAFSDKDVAAFLAALRVAAAQHALHDPKAGADNALNAMLSSALPTETQRLAFVNAVNTFGGADFEQFWSMHLPAQPEFGDNPKLVSNLLLTQQLTLLTGNHQALVSELQVSRKLDAPEKLLDLEAGDWVEIVKKAGVPAFAMGTSDDDRARNYAAQIQAMLNAAFPTRRIARMVEKNQLPIEKAAVGKGVTTFLSNNARFDFANSRIHAFDKEIETAAGEDSAAVKIELKKIQRVFQVSSSPEAMSALMQHNLHSAYSIANIPRKSFIKAHAKALGGEAAAFAIHQRAAHIAAKSEMTAMHMMEYSNSVAPQSALDSLDHGPVMTALKNQVPNYTELFGSPDLCECEHCRSVYGAAAYFVDLLRFLSRGDPNSGGKTPLDKLAMRRPDLMHLPLTCENTNTIIPYIDLANEVMEYYAAHGSLTNFEGYDTGATTADELRANPQNFNLEAYRKLKDAKYPFTLPYHQPLDVIRAYSDHLKVSRYDAMKAMNPQPDTTIAKAIAAESLRIAEEEHKVLAGAAFDGTPDTTALHQYFGYIAAGQLENMSAVPEFLRRSGVAYTDLVELVQAQFINPHQSTLDFLQRIFSYASIDADTIYARLKQVEAGTLNPATDTDLNAAITAYNTDLGASITVGEFAQWITDHLGEFRQVITLYEPDSKCDLESTKLRTIESIYENAPGSGIATSAWSKIHRYIRLWRKLGWTIHETDLMLAALGEDDITAATIAKLETVALLKTATKLPLNQLAVLWGHIDSYGNKSLYQKLFLNRAVQQIDAAFKPDAWGDYLQDGAQVLADHQSAILAAFRIREEDLTAILGVAEVIDGGVVRAIDVTTDVLNLANLSTIYRHVVLAKALKMWVTDLCQLIALFGVSPFSTWDIQQDEFTDIAPQHTYEFYRLAESTKKAGFKASMLAYILLGTLPADSKIGLAMSKVLGTVTAIRAVFAAIEQDHTLTPPAPLTPEILTAKLALTFQSGIVSRFMGMLLGTAPFETMTDANLNVAIPDALSGKYSYVKGSGRLTCTGVMSDGERSTLKGLANANPNFIAAIDRLYAAPDEFIDANFSGIFTVLTEAHATLLDHPAQPTPATLEKKLAYVYQHFIPLLKSKLRRDAITQHIAALIGLSEEATALLIAADIDVLIADLSTAGFSATYFSDANWTANVLQTTNDSVDFAWDTAAPDAALPADNFSARWEAYIAVPASGEYTLVVDVEEADEVFKLYLDDILALEKTGADAGTSWELVTTLNAAQMHLLRLEYAEGSQNAGVRLRWKTATTALEVVPASVAYPAAIVNGFVTEASVYHRAAKFISGFELSATELKHLIAFAPDFDNIDFKALTVTHWQRVGDYTSLRNSVPQAQALLTDVFALANTSNPAPSVSELKDLLYQASAWDAASLEFLVDTHFGLSVADFKNEIALNRLRHVMQIAVKSGLAAQTIAKWGAPETDFDALNDTAQLIKNTVKAKYEEQDWLDLAGDLSDTIRQHQRQGLIGYLLTRPAIQAWGAKDADGLFEYFLIDVQMGACMDTSRIVQANSSIQMFVSRCLLNLESNKSSGPETGVSPSAIDKDHWEWMKNYRVWEANRKVFLYPENWLEPEWRNDRSEFFKELESYLVQNDITERSVEQGFRNYLASLNEVANPEVCGIHRENYGNGKLKYLHVFARTHNAPYKFFYRRWNEYRKWSAWEQVALDIRCVESGRDSGVHLIPVVWKNRLFLFWPELMKTAEEQSSDSGHSVEDAFGDPISALAAKHYWEIRLAWSEYVDRKWIPKQVSKEFVKQQVGTVIPTEASLRWVYRIDPSQRLHLYSQCEFDGGWVELGEFSLADITSRVDTDTSDFATVNGWAGYRLSFMNYQKTGKLELSDDEYLSASSNHKLLISPTRDDYAPRLADPFFFSDRHHTYFVRPVSGRIFDRIRNPAKYQPYLPGITDHGKYIVEIDKPKILLDEPGPVASAAARGGGVAPDVDFEMQAAAIAQPVSPVSAGMPVMPMLEASGQSSISDLPIAATSKEFGVEMAQTGPALAGTLGMQAVNLDTLAAISYEKGLEFHTFYHPFSGRYVKRLNQMGLDGLLASDTAIASDNGATFEGAYDPNFTQDLVRKPSDFSTRTYYKENICFDVYGANSLYNWELFFHAPLYIATRLSKNGKYEEAMRWFHYIFDPTTDAVPSPGQSATSRYWKVPPFKAKPAEDLEDMFRDLASGNDPGNKIGDAIAEWRDSPFDPHLVAANRPLAYMKNVVIKYVENLVAWGDSLFRLDTMESVNEALQIYVIANHILGPRPQFVPKRGEIKAESYDSLKNKWDDFSNALVELENIFPYSSEASVSDSSTGGNLLGVGSSLYFCIPPNEKLLERWDTVADRLYKIRHCQNIDGVERKLALFSPPIDPAALIQAASQGLSLGSILADLSSPPPIYRFTFLIQKVNEFCSDVKALGSALLSTLEKKDAEELGRLRASHETQMLELMTAVRERQVLDAKVGKENLEKSRATVSFRLQHYVELLGNDSVTVPPAPSLSATLTADSQLPADTNIVTVETDVDESLADSGESGVKLIPTEKEQLDKTEAAKWVTLGAGTADTLAAVFSLFPQIDSEGTPFGVGVGAWWGGQNLGAGASAAARAATTASTFLSQEATQAATMATYIRREQDWTLQANLAAREIIQLDKQITSADIRIQVAEKELENHQQQIENTMDVELFLKDKFTNQELYQWMKEQLFSVYKQSYNLAYDMAKKAEKAYQYEMGTETASFIQYGYWDNSKQGLAAGEKLQLALRQLEKSYLEQNRRELELTKSISLARLNPLALIELRETGKCYVSVPEVLFDLDFRGHYFRRIKSARLSIPCVAGPYTVVNCSLRLLNNSVRINTTMNGEGDYEHENDEGLWIDDDRFRSNHAPVTAVATSMTQNDSGMFEFNFRDERYLPFEYAGAISEWLIELSTEKELRQFDYSTISDVILHLSYTARESGGLFKEAATTYMKDYLMNTAELADQPLMQMFDMKHEFPTEWYKFLHPAGDGAEQLLNFTLGKERFPFFVQDRQVVVMKIEVFAKCAQVGNYHVLLSYVNLDEDAVISTQITMPPNAAYGGLNKATINVNDAGLNLEELDIEKGMNLKVKFSSDTDYAGLGTDPDEIEDLFLVVHYKVN